MEHAKQNKRLTGGVSVGSSSILVIFVVLALTAFATLSLASANSDLRLTSRIADATQDYYTADAQGVEAIAALEQALAGLPSREIAGTAQALGWDTDGMYLSRSVEMEDGKCLEIAASWQNGNLRILRWQLVNNTDWEETGNFTLWGGPEMVGVSAP